MSEDKTAGIIDPSAAYNMSNEDLESLYAAFDEQVYEQAEIKHARMIMLQPQSPEITSQTPGFEQGMIVDSITKEVLSIKIVPPWLDDEAKKEATAVNCCPIAVIAKLPSEFIKWKDRKTEGPGFHWKTLDRNEKRVKEGVWKKQGGTFGTNESDKGKKPPVSENCNFLVTVFTHTGPILVPNIVLTFSSTSFDTGAVLTTYLSRHRFSALPPFGRIYWLWTLRTKSEKGYYYVYRVTPGPLLSDFCPSVIPDLIEAAKVLSNKETGYDYACQLINSADDGPGGDSDNSGSNENSGSYTDSGHPTADGETRDPFAGVDS